MTARMPRILSDIVGGLVAAEKDLELAGRADESPDILEAVRRGSLDVVVLGAPGTVLPDLGNELLHVDPWLKVLVVAHHGDAAMLYRLHPRGKPIGELSPATLLSAIRGDPQARSEELSNINRDGR